MQPETLNPTADGENQIVLRRIERLSLHLRPLYGESEQIWMAECRGGRENFEVRGEKLAVYMRGEYRDIQEKVIEFYTSRPELLTPVEILKDEHRDLCWRQLLALVREAGIRPFRYISEDPAKYYAIADAVGSIDISLGIKFGVQFR